MPNNMCLRGNVKRSGRCAEEGEDWMDCAIAMGRLRVLFSLYTRARWQCGHQQWGLRWSSISALARMRSELGNNNCHARRLSGRGMAVHGYTDSQAGTRAASMHP